MTRILLMLFTVLYLVAVPCLAMPPHPQNLLKIQSGKVPTPIFMSDPEYLAKKGIDQGLNEPPLSPGVRLNNFNILAVLVNFSDQAGTTLASFFDSLVFGVNTNTWGPTLRGFYQRASYGNLNIVTVNYPSSLGWKALPHNRRYYTAQGGSLTYGMGTYPNNSQGLCEDIVSILDPFINFANYDNNGDGYVDGLIIIHSGRGAELSLDTLDIWSHAWSITPQLRDGVYINRYCVDPEYRYNLSPNDATVGVFAHEMGHILGLPDLYDYGNDSYGLGYWSLMAYGSWNGAKVWPDTLSGISPAFLDAYSRVFLGFAAPINITCFQNNTRLPAVEDSAKVYRLWNMGSIGPEYYLVEYRYWLYTDSALHQAGVTIYHIDENQANNNNQWWPGLTPANHYRVALEQADGLYNLEHMQNGMDYNDPFPGTVINNTFNGSSSPSSKDYYNSSTNVAITEISAGSDVGFADFDVGATVAPSTPLQYGPDDGSATPYHTIGGNWWPTICTNYYHAQFDNDSNFSSPLCNDSMIQYNYTGCSVHYQPDGLYYWRVRARNSAGASPWSPRWSIFVDRQAPYGSTASSPDTAHSSSFVVSWTPGIDPSPSCGIDRYDVMCDTGAGPMITWLLNVDTLSYTFTGAINGHTYYFAALAWDRATNHETWSAWECSTYVSIEVPPCSYIPGDINSSGSVIASDVTYGVRYLKGIGTPPLDSCTNDSIGTLNHYLYVAADVNASCTFASSDITRLVAFFKGTAVLQNCRFFPLPILKAQK